MTNTETNGKAAAIAAPGAHVAPQAAPSKNGASRKKGAPTAHKKAPAAPPRKPRLAKRPPKANARPMPPALPARARKSWMIARPKGATLAEIMKAAGWQAHSVRGFLSTAGKKHKVHIESSKNEGGDRIYRCSK